MKLKLLALILSLSFLVGCQTEEVTKTNMFVEGTTMNLPMGMQPSEKDLGHISHALERVPAENSEIWFLSSSDPRVQRLVHDLDAKDIPQIAIEAHPLTPLGSECRKFVLHAPFLTNLSESLKTTHMACKNDDGKWEMK